ncbi:SDR family NAD(P)-dependent oxidoreductase [Flavobacterium arcticum]|uniref:SDR family NAD(P)-dependent oxidoreductase n=1 Tax=Flavobacterium arcticum TaxID=1784713 RepID=A0A345HB25_9FLAO|nr:SDR family oxidoreductase [Flavobacterium arcticum]AXG73785.1 SDR family NAD(P)-dependent oxidoreductase [Flavobacterium arcticum]KAF2511737.1 SDR family oxidoreductase [Flavobacterium arcticum]
MAQISILGCGWLGLPLAKQLIAKGHTVKGSTTSPEKIAVLQKAAIKPYVITLHENNIEGDSKGFLQDSNILIIDIPPGLRKGSSESFVAKINTLIPIMATSRITKVLFISSTSVYGAVNGIVTEGTIPNPETESGKQLLEVEAILQSNTNFKTTIIRFGGLIGDDRNPVKYLAGKKDISNPSAPVNLIHRDDCIGIIMKIIEKNVWGDVFNAVTPHHPTRQEYYTEKAKEKNLPIPLFSREEVSITKVIIADRVKQVLEYNFINTNL